MMIMSLAARFAGLFTALRSGKRPICIFDQDGTMTVKTGANEANMQLHKNVLGTVVLFNCKGGVYIPSSARSLAEIREAYVSIPDLIVAANDGYVISFRGKPDVIYGAGVLPDYTKFKADLRAFTASMNGVEMKDMGVYCGLFIDKGHPDRAKCERFFQTNVESVSLISKNLPMECRLHPMGITMEPAENRGKDGVIKFLMPFFDGDNILIVAGDADNDVAALQYAKDNGGFAIKVHQGVLLGVPDYATHEVAGPEECVELMSMMLEYMYFK